MANAPTLPAWIRDAGGRLEPFDGDRIAQRLYRALLESGRDDPLLSRELADGVLHFLATDQPPASLSASELAEHIIKIVRELGYPELARTLACRSANPIPAKRIATQARKSLDADDSETRWIDSVDAELQQSALNELGADLPRDVEAAISSGLLVPMGLSRKADMLGGVVRPTPPGRGGQPGWIEALLTARELYRGFIALDGPEWLLAESDADRPSWLREFRAGLNAKRLRVAVNLNVSRPPWAISRSGSLFEHDDAPTELTVSRTRSQLASELLAAQIPGVRIEWHYANPDSWLEADRPVLAELLRAARRGAPIVFVPDRRPECPALADGIDRANPELLGAVGIDWRRLEQAAAARGSDSDAFARAIRRLPQVVSLIAAWARASRRRFTERSEHPLQHAGRIERARFAVVPLATAASSGPADRVDGRMRLIVQTLVAALADHRDIRLTCAAPPLGFDSGELDWMPDAEVRSGADSIHNFRAALDASGTRVELTLPGVERFDDETGLSALAWAYRSTRASHVRLRRAATSRPLALDW